MKVKVAIITFALTCVVGLAGTVEWGNLVSGSQILDSNGVALDNVAIVLYYDWGGVGESVVDASSTLNIGVGDPVTGGFYFDSFAAGVADNGSVATVVVYDNAVVANATEYAVVGNWTVSGFVTGAEVVSQDFGGTVAGDWQAIPEPGTIALAIAGFGALIARRRRNRK